VLEATNCSLKDPYLHIRCQKRSLWDRKKDRQIMTAHNYLHIC